MFSALRRSTVHVGEIAKRVRDVPTIRITYKHFAVVCLLVVLYELAYVFPSRDLREVVIGGSAVATLVVIGWWIFLYAGPFVFTLNKSPVVNWDDDYLLELIEVRKNNRRGHQNAMMLNMIFAGAGFLGYMDHSLTSSSIFAAYALAAIGRYAYEDYKLYQFIADEVRQEGSWII